MGVVMERWCPTQQMLGVFLEGKMKKLLLAGTTLLLIATSVSAGPEPTHTGHWVASGQWQMTDIGRNHGVLGGSPSAIPGYRQSALACILGCLRRFHPQDETQPPLTATYSETQTCERGLFYRGAVPGNRDKRRPVNLILF